LSSQILVSIEVGAYPMKAATFDYVRAENLEHALSVLEEVGSESKLIAGGQSLVPMMAMRFARPSLLIDINRLDELKQLTQDVETIRFGACIRQRDIEFNSSLDKTVPLVKKALNWVGHTQTRNRGTIGGSLSFADPSAELPLAAQVLGATMHLQNASSGVRSVEANDFFLGPMYTAIAETECLVAIDFPVWSGSGIGTAFTEVAMRKGDFAIASAACQLQIDSQGIVKRIAFGAGGVNGAPKAFPQLAEKIVGKALTTQLAQEIANEAIEQCDPGSDTHNTAQFRKSLGATLLARVLIEALENAMGSK
jgi:carbon-monoxide dehydrogenase medium subunit/2-furoyl-CoA dehydrogenase FAD binding subunit